jgi:thiol-disulfide isomerase/thioredoxin
MKEILFFYGTECPSCIIVEPHVDKLISEGFNIRKIEVWHNLENDKLLMELDVGENRCGGIPFFLNQITGKSICGEATYKEIKNWAEGK